jgi:hypothetical protein
MNYSNKAGTLSGNILQGKDTSANIRYKSPEI